MKVTHGGWLVYSPDVTTMLLVLAKLLQESLPWPFGHAHSPCPSPSPALRHRPAAAEIMASNTLDYLLPVYRIAQFGTALESSGLVASQLQNNKQAPPSAGVQSSDQATGERQFFLLTILSTASDLV